MATIKAIDRSSVHQIQSGQVIVDLCSVAKELVENSIDAGATAIDVRFRNQGLDAIEVQDNGSGIEPHNYASLALKHHTSKLADYRDLATLQTFGFRGEALSSLCALSRFTVVTCTAADAPRARRLEFEPSGALAHGPPAVVSAQKGTSVLVEDLFRTLPVRRRELERNVKREWGKVVGLLSQYACVQTGVKFTLSQQPTKGKRMVLFSTRGNPTTRENIINVFGVKTMNALVALDLKLEFAPTATAMAAHPATNTEVCVVGHVSRPAHGEGRQTPDRQMFYVNGRPCGLPQFAKVFNEVYRGYNSSQSPFIFADIRLDTRLYDVNVSPDKRTILLHDQGRMLENLRDALVELFETQDITIPVAQASQAQTQKQTPFRQLSINTLGTPASDRTGRGGNRSAVAMSPLLRVSSGPGANARQASEEEREEKDEHDDEEEEEEEVASSRLPGFAPASSTFKNVQGKSLLSKWASKDADGGKPTEIQASTQSPEPTRNGASEDDSQNDSSQAHGEEHAPEASKPRESPPHTGRDAEPSLSDAEGAKAGEVTSVCAAPDKSPEAQQGERDVEEPVPRSSILSIGRPPKRPTADDVVMVTIGDQTLTSTATGSQVKRQKLHGPASSTAPRSSGARRRKKPSAPLPSFGGRLSQIFSALDGSTQKEPPEDIEHGSEEDSEDGDVDMEGETLQVGDESGVEEEKEEEEEEDGNRPGGDENERKEEGGEEEEEEEDSIFVRQDRDVDDDASPGPEPAEVDDREGEPAPSQEADDADDDAASSRGSPGGHDGHASDCTCGDDDEYMDETEKKAREEKKVQEMIRAAEEAAASKLTEDSEKRSQMLMKGRARRKDSTLALVQTIRVDEGTFQGRISKWRSELLSSSAPESQKKEAGRFRGKKAVAGGGDGEAEQAPESATGEGLEAPDAEEKLSLKISKSDFAKMRIVGQFNLGFILAVREAATAAAEEKKEEEQEATAKPAGSESPTGRAKKRQRKRQRPKALADDELFIIDQHASDEKYNFERLQAASAVQSQRLVHPRQLELTAVEEEIVAEHGRALTLNGFDVRLDASGARPVGRRCDLLSLPLSRETTFSVADLEELIFLLGESPSSSSGGGEDGNGDGDGVGRPQAMTTVPRPSKVRSMFAMRACRSSVMIGRALSRRQMARVVAHMGGMEKPWNCPHGRPTMRHLCGLGAAWGGGRGWSEEGMDRGGGLGAGGGGGVGFADYVRDDGTTDWGRWVKERRGTGG